jgi:hypothetical protein
VSGLRTGLKGLVILVSAGVFAYVAVQLLQFGGAWVALACLAAIPAVLGLLVACGLFYATYREAVAREHS